MTEEERKAQKDFIKEELGAFTKAALIETLAERGIKASEKAKKEILLDMLAESIELWGTLALLCIRHWQTKGRERKEQKEVAL